jgi:hypothetical protein
MANSIIMLDQPFRHYIIDQTIARIDRLGQDTQTYVYNALLNTGDISNISTRSKDIMEEAKSLVEAIMGIKVPEGDLIGMEDFGDLIEEPNLSDHQIAIKHLIANNVKPSSMW